MESGIFAAKWLVAILSMVWIGNKLMNPKQHYLIGLYFTYCFVNGYAVAAAMLPSQSITSPEAFILGLAGAVSVCAWLTKIDSSPKTYGTLIASMLIAGFGSYHASKYLVYKCGCSSIDELRYIMPLVIGSILPLAVPIGLTFATNKWGKDSGKDGSNV